VRHTGKEDNSSFDPDSARKSQTRDCVLCETATEHEVLFEKWGYPILRCSGCQLTSTDIRRDFDAASIYSQGYFCGARRDGYADYAGSEPVLRKEFRRMIERLHGYDRSAKRLLEIGCAHGFFLLEAQRYFECYGIEISDEAAKLCQSRGLTVHCGTVESEFLKANSPFDAVVMLDVIEHLQNPAEVLKMLYASLSRRGLLMISTGDWASALARIMKKHWRLMTPPQHLFFFSRKTLIDLLSKAGFRVVYCARPWKSVPLGLAAYQMGNRLGTRLRFLESLNWLAAPVNLFDTIQVIARKE
jgi:SAM-dependent methyltransferase